jgi:hypothetical protein
MSRFSYPTRIFTSSRPVKNGSPREIKTVLHFGEGQERMVQSANSFSPWGYGSDLTPQPLARN